MRPRKHRRTFTIKRGALPGACFVFTACASAPLMLVRPARMDMDGLGCVRTTLLDLGYTITAGDRSLGFVRAQRDDGGRNFLTGDKKLDVLLVNYVDAGTAHDRADDEIRVRASRLIDRSPGALTALAMATGDPFVVVEHGTDEVGPRKEAVADAEHLLDRCGPAPPS